MEYTFLEVYDLNTNSLTDICRAEFISIKIHFAGYFLYRERNLAVDMCQYSFNSHFLFHISV
jgi:hypothetical protein